MDEFIVVLPSNVASIGGAKNTASDYKTSFENAIHLPESEKWQVALHEISFVDAIQTIDDEYYTIATPTEAEDAQYTYPYLTNEIIRKEDSIEKPTSKDPSKETLYQIRYLRKADFAWSESGKFKMGYDSEKERFYIETFEEKIQIKMAALFVSLFGIKEVELANYLEKEKTSEKANVDKYKELILIDYPKKGKHYFATSGTSYPYSIIVELKFISQDIRLQVHYHKQANFSVKQFPIKRGYYRNGTDLVQQLNVKGTYFHFDAPTNRFSIKGITNGKILRMHPTLTSILGFENDIVEHDMSAKNAPNNRRGIHNLFIYSNICEPVRVGNSHVPLLRTVNFKRGTFGETVDIIYNNPIYTNVSKSFIDSIEILIMDDMGRKIPFEEGKTIVTLQFRRL